MSVQLQSAAAHQKRWQTARFFAALFFAIDGIGFGVWAAHIPVFKDRLQLSSLALSQVLLALVLGSIVTMPLAGRAIAHIGSRRVIWIACTTYILTLAALAFVTNLHPLILIAALYGASKGALDVSVNAQGVWIERNLNKTIVSSFQGCWSLGGLIAAMLSSWAISHGAGTHEDFLVTAAVLLILALASAAFLAEGDGHQSGEKPKFRMPDPGLLKLAGIAFLGLFAEGAMADWGGVYLKSSVGVSLAQAAIGYAAFSLSMAAGRFLGDWLLSKFHGITILRVSGLLLFTGLAFTLALNTWWAAMAGFICAGFGVANIVPVIWGVAGRNRILGAGPAIATVSTTGYFGFLAGPPLIGAVATLLNVREALIIVCLFGLAIAAASRRAMRAAE